MAETLKSVEMYLKDVKRKIEETVKDMPSGAGVYPETVAAQRERMGKKVARIVGKKIDSAVNRVRKYFKKWTSSYE